MASEMGCTLRSCITVFGSIIISALIIGPFGLVPWPGRARAGSHFGGFDDRPGGAAAGLPDFGTPGSAHTILTRTGHPVAVSACFSVSVALSFLRGLLGAAGGGRAASTPSRGSL
jgi:hypothetical protein